MSRLVAEFKASINITDRMAGEKTSGEPLHGVPPNPLPKRSWWKSEPMDEQGSRTMFIGLIIAFALYAVSFVVTAVYREYSWANWLSIGLILTSVLFLGGWFLAVRGGFRIGKTKSRSDRRAKMHAEKEREKRMRLNR